MAQLSPTDAAFEGFRIPREQPMAVLVWSGLQLVVGLVMSTVMITLGGHALADLMAASNSRNPDPEATMAAMRALGPFYAVLLPLGIIVQSVFSAAIYRVVLRPQDRGMAFIRLGADEMRLAAVSVVYIGVAALAAFAVTLAASIVAGFGVAVAGAAGGLFAAVVALAGIAALVYGGVRLSLAPVQTFAERRIRLFESWELTRGHFWRLAGAYLLALALTVLVLVLSMTLFSFAAAAMHGGDMATAMRSLGGDTSSLQAYFTPTTLVYLVFSAVLNALYYALIFAPGAVAYRQLAQVGLSDAFS